MRILILIIIFSISSFANNYKSNLEIVDSLLLNELDLTSKYLNTILFDKTELEIIDQYKTGIFYSNVLQKFTENNIDFAGFTSDGKREVDGLATNTRVELTKINIKYILTDNDQIVRNINVQYFMQHLNANEDFYKNYDISYSDIVPADIVSELQNGPNEYLKAPIPKKRSSFFKKYTQPILIIGSAVVSLVLLFTIRSG